MLVLSATGRRGYARRASMTSASAGKMRPGDSFLPYRRPRQLGRHARCAVGLSSAQRRPAARKNGGELDVTIACKDGRTRVKGSWSRLCRNGSAEVRCPHRERRRAAGDQARRAARPFRAAEPQFLSIESASRDTIVRTLAQVKIYCRRARAPVGVRKISIRLIWTHVGGECDT